MYQSVELVCSNKYTKYVNKYILFWNKAKILFILSKEYSEVIITADANLNMSLKLIKKSIVKFCKYKIKSKSENKQEANLVQVAYCNCR